MQRCCSFTGSRTRTTQDILSQRLTTKTKTYRLHIAVLSCQHPLLNFLDMATWLHRKSCSLDSCHQDNAGLILGLPRCSPSFFGDTENGYYTKNEKAFDELYLKEIR